MPRRIADVQPPTGLKRAIFRAPIWLYRINLGGLLGNRFLLLTHRGRSSGRPRKTVVEVAAYDPESETYYIASGYGRRADWYLNVLKSPEVTIQVGRQIRQAKVQPLLPQESGQAMVRYAHRFPRTAKQITRMCGFEVDGSDEDFYIIGRDYIPFLAVQCRS